VQGGKLATCKRGSLLRDSPPRLHLQYRVPKVHSNIKKNSPITCRGGL
jgi:hypothetical protein